MSTETRVSLDEQVSMEIFGRLKMEDGILIGSIPSAHNHIEIAWEVVEEMERRGLLWEIRRYATDPGAYGVTFVRPGRDRIFVTGSSPAEAICLAALAAVRGEKEQQP